MGLIWSLFLSFLSVAAVVAGFCLVYMIVCEICKRL